MRKSITLTLALCCCITFMQAQNTVVISGKLTDIKNDELLFLYSRLRQKTDTLRFINGEINCTLKMDSGDVYDLVPGIIQDPFNYTSIYLQPGKLHITGSAKNLKDLRFSGSPFAEDQDQYMLSINNHPIVQEALTIYRKFASVFMKDTLATKALEPDLKRLALQEDSVKKAHVQQWIKTHPHSDINSMLLYKAYMEGKKPPYGVTAKNLEQLSENAARSLTTTYMRNKIYFAEKLAVGKNAPDFTLYDTSNNAVTLSQFKGRYVLLDFWASWCKPCREENPWVIKAYNTYKEKGFVVLAVSADRYDQRAAWIKAIQDDKLNYLHAWEPQNKINQAMEQYDISGIPDNFLISPDGVILAKYLRGEGLIKKLEEIFNLK